MPPRPQPPRLWQRPLRQLQNLRVELKKFLPLRTGEIFTPINPAANNVQQLEAFEKSNSTEDVSNSSGVPDQPTQTPVDLPLGWPHPVWVDEEILRRPRTQDTHDPVKPKLTGMIIGKTVIDEVRGAKKFQATAG